MSWGLGGLGNLEGGMEEGELFFYPKKELFLHKIPQRFLFPRIPNCSRITLPCLHIYTKLPPKLGVKHSRTDPVPQWESRGMFRSPGCPRCGPPSPLAEATTLGGSWAHCNVKHHSCEAANKGSLLKPRRTNINIHLKTSYTVFFFFFWGRTD